MQNDLRRENMTKVTVCIGSSCHIRGSKEVADKFIELVKANGLENDVEVSGTFCLGNCRNGVSVAIDDEIFATTPEDAEAFFNEKVLSKVKK